MKEAKVSVVLIGMTSDAQSIIYAAYKQCYADGFVGNSWEEYAKAGDTPEGRRMQGDFIKALLKTGHDSPIEHVTLNFAVSGISRACSHQLVRHRIASYSQQSQRYVNMSDASVIVPPSIKHNDKANDLYRAYMQTMQETYIALVGLLTEDGTDIKKAQEDARFVLANAAETQLVMSFNCRSLLNFFDLRCCNRAQWEIRRMADAMLALARTVLPEVFMAAGAKCDRLGYCPEDVRFTCGKVKTLNELLAKE